MPRRNFSKSRRFSRRSSKTRSTCSYSKYYDSDRPFSFFDKIYIINLEDQYSKFKEVSDQLVKYDIPHERFLAIDGRGKDPKIVKEKKKMFEDMYDLKIKLSPGFGLGAASLSIGTVLILRDFLADKSLERILIFEDDIVLDKNIINMFKDGIRELDHSKDCDWDLLYLSCGGQCGHRDVTWTKRPNTPHLTTWSLRPDEDMTCYVKHPWDLRVPCSRSDCNYLGKYLSYTALGGTGGTWSYAFSRKGAEKFMKFLKNSRGKTVVSHHIDQLLMQAHDYLNLKVIAFDPVITYHKYGLGGHVEGVSIDW